MESGFVFRRIKFFAARGGMSLRRLAAAGLKEKFYIASAGEKPWMKHFGKLKRLHKETNRVDRFIEEAFEQIDWEIWK